MPIPATLADRLRAAWRAFQCKTKPDPDAFNKWRAEQHQAFLNAAAKLPDEQCKAVLKFEVAREQVSGADVKAFFTAINTLPVADGFAALKYVTSHDKRMILHAEARQYTSRADVLAYVTEISKQPRR